MVGKGNENGHISSCPGDGIGVFQAYEKTDSLADRIVEARRQLDAENEQRDNTQQWVELISQYREITELDAETLNRLLNKIVVHETIDEQHVRHLSIEIHFNFKQMPGVECYTPQEQRPYRLRTAAT